MKRIVFPLLLATLSIAEADAQSVSFRHDKSNYQTFKNMELPGTGWSWRGTPAETYWYSTYKKKINMPWPIPDFTITVPGEGWHDDGYWGWGFNLVPNVYTDNFDWWYNPTGFVDESWRKFLTYRTGAVAESYVEKQNKADEEDYWKNMLDTDMAVMVDKNLNSDDYAGWMAGLAASLAPSGFSNDVIKWVSKNFAEAIARKVVQSDAYDITTNLRDKAKEVIDAGMAAIDEPEVALAFGTEYLRLTTQINVINNSYMLDASKMIELKSANDRLDRLKKEINIYLLAWKYKKEMEADAANVPSSNGTGTILDDIFKNHNNKNSDDESSVLENILNQVDLGKL